MNDNDEMNDIKLMEVLLSEGGLDDMEENDEEVFNQKEVREIVSTVRLVFSEEREEFIDDMYSISQRRYAELREGAKNDFNSSMLEYEINRKRKDRGEFILGFVLWASWGVICFVAGKGGI